MVKITAHVLVKNEENFIWFALMSVLDFVEEVFVYDTGSKDKTVQIIKSIDSPKIIFVEKGEKNSRDLVNLRNEMMEKTKTPWFLLLDGDEVWPKETIVEAKEMTERAAPDKMALVLRTRNCVGDIYHYLPEEVGGYQILNMKGHFNIRLYRRTDDYQWQGIYPLEAYVDKSGQAVNYQKEKLLFLDKYIWHLTHLNRSRFDDHNKGKLELGIPFPPQTHYPEALYLQRPEMVSNPWIKMSGTDWFKAVIQIPLKRLKRRLTHAKSQ